MSRFRFLSFAAIVGVAAALSACGFHLRGALTLPPDVGAISVQSRLPYSPLAQGVVEALNRAGASAALDDGTAAAAEATSGTAATTTTPTDPNVASVTGDTGTAPVATTGTPTVDGNGRPVAVLRIRSEQWASTPISVDQFGRAQEFTLRYAVVFSLDKPDGSVFVPQQAVELARDYISVPTNSTGTEGERELLAREMRKDMTASILRRIDAAARAPAAPPEAPATDASGARETLPDPTATP